jgi:eukaryotic-like serine/threonine-protein kinase
VIDSVTTASGRLLPGKLGKYQVRRELGVGGMGVVYEGYDPLIQRRVALKTVNETALDGTQGAELASRLQREAQAAGRLTHPNIVAVYDYGEDVVRGANGSTRTTAFIAMELVEGRELKSYLESGERFSIASVHSIMAQLLDALAYSHRHGVVHRDIKPANIILLADGTLKVADFGIARIESSTLTQMGTVLGSPNYMSPEQFMGQTVDGRSDLYSAGIVLFELLTGEVPYSGSYTAIMHRTLHEAPPPPTVLNVQVPREFDRIVLRALAKRPDERFQTAADFKQQIDVASASCAAGMDPSLRAPAAAAGILGSADPSGQATLVRPLGAKFQPPPDEQQPAVSARLTGVGTQQPHGRVRVRNPPSRRNEALVLIAIWGVALAAIVGTAYVYRGAWLPALTGKSSTSEGRSSPDTAIAGAAAAGNPGAAGGSNSSPGGDTAVISAVGLADPQDPSYSKNPTAVRRSVAADARRQLVEKAAALYVDPRSLNDHYGLLREKLLASSGNFITTVLAEPPPQLSKYGLVAGTVRATVKVREVQKSLNQLARAEGIEFIRNNGDPRIAVHVQTVLTASAAADTPQESAVAENLLKERIRSFGFRIFDDTASKPDFRIESEARLKKLSATLPASGLTIEKYVLTSWTVRAVDVTTGEEIFHNTTLPEKQSWGSQELALQDVGRLVGDEFSKTFFLQYFHFQPRHARLEFSNVPPQVTESLLAEINASLGVLDTALAGHKGNMIVIDTTLSGGSEANLPDLLRRTVLGAINRKLGKDCFATGATTDNSSIAILFDSQCNDPGTLNRLESLPPGALMEDTSAPRLEDVIKNPETLRKLRT